MIIDDTNVSETELDTLINELEDQPMYLMTYVNDVDTIDNVHFNDVDQLEQYALDNDINYYSYTVV